MMFNPNHARTPLTKRWRARLVGEVARRGSVCGGGAVSDAQPRHRLDQVLDLREGHRLALLQLHLSQNRTGLARGGEGARGGAARGEGGDTGRGGACAHCSMRSIIGSMGACSCLCALRIAALSRLA